MKIHVVTPLGRPENARAVYAGLMRAGCDRWHVVTHQPHQQIDIPHDVNVVNASPRGLAAHDLSVGKEPFDWCYSKLNAFIERLDTLHGLNVAYQGDDYYGFLCDDDGVDEAFFCKLRESVEDCIVGPDVIFCSMHYAPPGKPGNKNADLILSSSSDVKVGMVGLEQYYVRGDVLRQHRFREKEHAADGMLATELLKMRECVFVPDVFVKFNALRPGWWS